MSRCALEGLAFKAYREVQEQRWKELDARTPSPELARLLGKDGPLADEKIRKALALAVDSSSPEAEAAIQMARRLWAAKRGSARPSA